MVILSGLTPNSWVSDDTGHPFVIVSLSSPGQSYSLEDKGKLLEYMKKGYTYSAGGYVYDLVKNEETKIEGIGYDDGCYSWDSDDIYHIEKYNGAVSEDFMNHVLQLDSSLTSK